MSQTRRLAAILAADVGVFAAHGGGRGQHSPPGAGRWTDHPRFVRRRGIGLLGLATAETRQPAGGLRSTNFFSDSRTSADLLLIPVYSSAFASSSSSSVSVSRIPAP